MHKKFGQGRDLNPRPSNPPQKHPNLPLCTTYIGVAVKGSQLIKLIKSVTSLVLKKKRKKVTTIVCVFLRKARTKNNKISEFNQKTYLEIPHTPAVVSEL